MIHFQATKDPFKDARFEMRDARHAKLDTIFSEYKASEKYYFAR